MGHGHVLTIRGRYGPDHVVAAWFPQHLAIAMQIDMEEDATGLKTGHEEPFSICCPIHTDDVVPVVDDDVLQCH